jgi:ABC-type uncharacterized transport system permease subunit
MANTPLNTPLDTLLPHSVFYALYLRHLFVITTFITTFILFITTFSLLITTIYDQREQSEINGSPTYRRRDMALYISTTFIPYSAAAGSAACQSA